VTVDLTGALLADGIGPGQTPSGIRSRVVSSAPPLGGGEAPGHIEVSARTIDLGDGALISARTTGAIDAGDVDVSATHRITLRGGDNGTAEISARGADGNGGRVDVAASRVELLDGGVIAATTVGTGQGGDVVVTGTQIVVSGASQAGATPQPSAIRSQSLKPTDGGDAGGITIDGARSVVVRDGGVISVDTEGQGNAGSISIRSGGRIQLSGGARVSSRSASSGAAGSIELGGKDESYANVLLTTGASISAESVGDAPAGSIAIDRVGSVAMIGSEITTNAAQSSGGRVVIRATEKVELVASRITTEVEKGDDSAGDIVIDPRYVVLNASRISGDSKDLGRGGNVLIVAGTYLQARDSRVSASSALGIDGTVVIRSPEGELAGQTSPLTERFFDASALLRAPCAARRREAESSFLVREREALPIGPAGHLPLPLPDLEADAEGEGADLSQERDERLALGPVDWGCATWLNEAPR
jgi:hypothetical protein